MHVTDLANKLYVAIKMYSIMLIFPALPISSCTNTQDEAKTQEQEENHLEEKAVLPKELNEAEERALDALDTIQISGSQFYATFPEHEHDCHGNISSYIITSEEFEDALIDLLNQHCLDMPKEKGADLAFRAAKAQEEYIVRTCGSASKLLILEELEAPPKSGMWIFPSLLGQRDLVIQW